MLNSVPLQLRSSQIDSMDSERSKHMLIICSYSREPCRLFGLKFALNLCVVDMSHDFDEKFTFFVQPAPHFPCYQCTAGIYLIFLLSGTRLFMLLSLQLSKRLVHLTCPC